MQLAQDNPPATDEIEISVFGPGYGEAIVVHLGDGKWLTIDSCIDPLNSEVAPIRYLRSLGVSLETDVVCVVATHWHDDHIRGMAKLVSEAKTARFVCASTMTAREFLAYALRNSETDTSVLPRATIEIVTTLRILRQREVMPTYAAPDRLLWETMQPMTTRLSSLSPSDARMHNFLSRVACERVSPGETRRRASDLSPNDLSVVLFLETPFSSAVFGADLEETNYKAWSHLLQETFAHKNKPADFFKVPHHGSATGHCSDVWRTMLTGNPVSVITPWANGGNSLPSEEDVKRILGYTDRAFSSATPKAKSTKRLPASVRKSLAERNIKLKLAEPRFGHVRARRRSSESDWRLETFGTAVKLQNIY